MRHPSSQADPQHEEVIAIFGKAHLVKLPDRSYQLIGGSAADIAAASEWIALFMTNDVVHGLPPGAAGVHTKTPGKPPDCS